MGYTQNDGITEHTVLCVHFCVRLCLLALRDGPVFTLSESLNYVTSKINFFVHKSPGRSAPDELKLSDRAQPEEPIVYLIYNIPLLPLIVYDVVADVRHNAPQAYLCDGKKRYRERQLYLRFG